MLPVSRSSLKLILASTLAGLLSGCGSTGPVVTKSEYDQLNEGMSYSQVVSLIGNDGVENSSGTMNGIPGFMESIKTVVYSWQNPDGSNMNAVFQNDKLITKAQFGLR